MVIQAERELPALPSRRGGKPAAPTKAVSGIGVAPVQTEDPDRSPQHRAGFGARGE